MDNSLFKAFCDGKAQTTVLYQDGSNSIELKSKAIITANTMPNIKLIQVQPNVLYHILINQILLMM